MKKNIVVVWGGNSLEHEISIITGVEALHNMPIKGYNAIPIYLKSGKFYTGDKLGDINSYKLGESNKLEEVYFVGKQLYKKNKFLRLKKICDVDCAVLATHGGVGEDGTLQGFFACNNIPFTSCGVQQSALCMDKFATKLRLISNNTPVIEGKLLSKNFKDSDITDIENDLGYPLIVKPNNAGSSIGIAKALCREELAYAMEVGFKYDAEILIEKYIANNIELNISAVKINGIIETSTIEKPITASEILTFEDKYISDANSKSTREFPANIPEELAFTIKEMTKNVYSALNLSGIVRIDYLLAKDKIYLNEINSIPGSLSHYLYENYTYNELLKAVIEETIKVGCKKELNYRTNILENFGGIKHK